MKLIYIISILAIFSIGLITHNSFAIEWKNYTNDKYGLSLQIPTTWNIVEKQDRIKDPYGPDIKFINPDNKDNLFAFADSEYQVASDIASLGLELAAHLNIADVEKVTDINVIGSPDFTTYKISGFNTSSTIAKYLDSDMVIENFIIDKNEKGTVLAYQNNADLFDSPMSQEILEHLVSSIKFTK